jgi:hypothetical protein
VSMGFRENVILVNAAAGLVGFVVMGIFSLQEWLTDDPRYLKDAGFALLWLTIGLSQLWRWRQRQLRM